MSAQQPPSVVLIVDDATADSDDAVDDALPDVAFLERVVHETCCYAGRAQAEVSLRLVDEFEGRALNRDYRGVDAATNVLSFPFDSAALGLSAADDTVADAEPGVADILGDLVICVPVLRHEARAQRKSFRDHLAHLTVHGVLHLLGYDHVDDADANAMESAERRVLSRFEICDPYQVDAPLEPNA